MELIRQNRHALWGGLTQSGESLLIRLSRLSLAATLILLPMRFRWVIQARPVPPLYAEYTNLYLYPTDILLSVTLGLWLFRLALYPRHLSLKPHLLTLALSGLWVFCAASSVFSIDPLLSRYAALRLLLLFGAYLYLINNPPRLVEVVAALGLQVGIQASIGLAQVLRQHSLGLVILQELKLDPSVSGISIIWADGVRSLRAYGLTDHPNILGGCLTIGVLLLAVAYAANQSWWRPLLAGLFALGALGLLATFSRSAWLGLVAGLALLSLWALARHEGGILRSWTGLAGGTALILAPFLWANAVYLDARLNFSGSFAQATPENQAINERALLIDQAGQIFARHPLTGVGLAAYPQAFRKQVPDYPFTYEPPHLVLLETAAETGLPGAIVYLLAVAAPWLLLLRGPHRLHGKDAVSASALFVALKPNGPITPSSPVSNMPDGDFDLRHSWLPLAGISAALLALNLIAFLDYYLWLSNSGLLLQWLAWGLWGAWFRTQ